MILKRFSKYANLELLIILLVIVVGGLFFRFVTDDYSAFGFGCAAKQFSDFHYFEYFWQGFIGFSDVYRFIYGISDVYNWMYISWVIFGFGTLYLSLRFIRWAADRNKNPVWVVLLIEILFSILYLENYYSLSHTRFSLMFCGLGLINLAFREKLRIAEVVAYSALFTAGMLVRWESGMGMLLLIIVARLIYRFEVFLTLRRLSIPVLVFGIIIGAIVYDIYTTDDFVKRLEPEIEYSYMERKTVDISTMKTARDSIKYSLALKGMWFDPKEISPEFMRSLIKPGSNISKNHVKVALEHISLLYIKYIGFPMLMIAQILILLALRKWKLAIKLSLFVLFSFLLLYGVDFKGLLLSGRHFMSFQLTVLLITTFFFFSEKIQLNRWGTFFFTLVSIPTGLAIMHTFSVCEFDNASIWSTTDNMGKAMRYIESKYTGRLVVVTNESRYWFDLNPTFKNHVYNKNTYMMFDHGTYSMMPRYSDYYKRLTGYGVESPEKIMKWFSDQNALYMADHERYGLTQTYFREIYDMEFEFSDSVNINQASGVDNFTTQDYEIRSIKMNTKANR